MSLLFPVSSIRIKSQNSRSIENVEKTGNEAGNKSVFMEEKMMNKCVGCSLYNVQKPDSWKDIEGYEEQYRVSNKGEIQRKKKDGAWKTKTTKLENGYRAVRLSKSGKKKEEYVHRLVAKAFIDNPENKETVDHINGKKICNCADNLRWATQKENNEYHEQQKRNNQPPTKQEIL